MILEKFKHCYDPFTIKFNYIISWDLLTLCNYKCPYCYVFNDKNYVPLVCEKSKIDKIISGLNKLNNLQLSLLGGEPLLSPHLKYILEKIDEKKGNEYLLYTNGTLLNTFNPTLFRKFLIIISYHPSEIKCLEFIDILKYAQSNNLKIIVHAMFTSKKYYNDIRCVNDFCKKNNIIINIATNYNNKIIENFPVFFKNAENIIINTRIEHLFAHRNDDFYGSVCNLKTFRILADGRCFNVCSGNYFNISTLHKTFWTICKKHKCPNECLFTNERIWLSSLKQH